MLDKNSKKVLAILNRLAGKDGIILDHKLISENIPRGYTPFKLVSTLEYLQDLGYLEFDRNVEYQVVFVKLSHKGLNYKNLEWVEVKTFIIRSIIVPIIVSVLTTLIIKLLF